MSLLLLVIYSALILMASLAGGWVPLFVKLTHTRMQIATSFVAGLMLGVGLLHLLPHGWRELGSVDHTIWWLLTGFLLMFFIQRFFQFHHHEVPGENGLREVHSHEHSPEMNAAAQAHPHGHAGEQVHAHVPGTPRVGIKSLKLTWGGAALGLTAHTLTEGIALAASVRAENQAGEHNWLLGFSTFLVIVLHKPFDAMAITTLMTAAGWSKFSRHCVNALFALAFPLGLLAFQLLSLQFGDRGNAVVGAALALAAGTFLCIASSDLLPELQFHSHDRIKLSAALLGGLLLAVLMGLFEKTGHDHKNENEKSGAVFQTFFSIASTALPSLSRG